jgi:hypothetical protein
MPIASPPNASQTYLQQGNNKVLLSWNIVPGATSYNVQRSIDGSTFATVATPTVNEYLDTAVTVNTQYWYRVASVNGSGTSGYTVPTPVSIIPVVAGYMSLQQIRTLAQQKADRVNSNFITLPEWNSYINLAADELYDLITTIFDDYNMAEPVYFTTSGQTQSYPLPDGLTTFQNANGQNIVPPPIYKLSGIDLGLNNAPNGFVTVQKYNFIDRNRYVFPNTASTIYGVFGLQYRFIGNSIRFIPQPSSSQPIRIWYIPRREQLLRESDVTDGYNGWTNYIIARAAKYALDKEESDSSKIDAELVYLKQRIEESAPNRDQGQPDTVSDGRMASGFGPDGGGGWQGPFGTGW